MGRVEPEQCAVRVVAAGSRGQGQREGEQGPRLPASCRDRRSRAPRSGYPHRGSSVLAAAFAGLAGGLHGWRSEGSIHEGGAPGGEMLAVEARRSLELDHPDELAALLDANVPVPQNAAVTGGVADLGRSSPPFVSGLSKGTWGRAREATRRAQVSASPPEPCSTASRAEIITSAPCFGSRYMATSPSPMLRSLPSPQMKEPSLRRTTVQPGGVETARTGSGRTRAVAPSR